VYYWAIASGFMERPQFAGITFEQTSFPTETAYIAAAARKRDSYLFIYNLYSSWNDNHKKRTRMQTHTNTHTSFGHAFANPQKSSRCFPFRSPPVHPSLLFSSFRFFAFRALGSYRINAPRYILVECGDRSRVSSYLCLMGLVVWVYGVVMRSVFV